MNGFGDTTPRFNWRHRQDDGWGWSSAHTVDGPCPRCIPRDAPTQCPRCGGRLHREPAIVDDGLIEALFCQQERADGDGRSTRMRSAPSEAQIRARLDREKAERRAMWDRWFKGAVMLWLVVGTVVTVGGLLVALVSMVVYDR